MRLPIIWVVSAVGLGACIWEFSSVLSVDGVHSISTVSRDGGDGGSAPDGSLRDSGVNDAGLTATAHLLDIFVPDASAEDAYSFTVTVDDDGTMSGSWQNVGANRANYTFVADGDGKLSAFIEEGGHNIRSVRAANRELLCGFVNPDQGGVSVAVVDYSDGGRRVILDRAIDAGLVDPRMPSSCHRRNSQGTVLLAPWATQAIVFSDGGIKLLRYPAGDGGRDITGSSLSENGEVVGSVTNCFGLTPQVETPCPVYVNGDAYTLVKSEGRQAVVRAINSKGEMAGDGVDVESRHMAIYWASKDGSPVYLPLTDGYDVTYEVTGISTDGIIVGTTFDYEEERRGVTIWYQQRPYVLDSLVSVPGCRVTDSWSINSSNRIAVALACQVPASDGGTVTRSRAGYVDVSLPR